MRINIINKQITNKKRTKNESKKYFAEDEVRRTKME